MYNPLRKLWERMLLSSLCGEPRRARCRIPRQHGTTPRKPRLTPMARRACSAACLGESYWPLFPVAYATGCTKIAHPALHPRYSVHSYPRYNFHSEDLRQGGQEPRSGDFCTTRCVSCGTGGPPSLCGKPRRARCRSVRKLGNPTDCPRLRNSKAAAHSI